MVSFSRVDRCNDGLKTSLEMCEFSAVWLKGDKKKTWRQVNREGERRGCEGCLSRVVFNKQTPTQLHS